MYITAIYGVKQQHFQYFQGVFFVESNLMMYKSTCQYQVSLFLFVLQELHYIQQKQA